MGNIYHKEITASFLWKRSRILFFTYYDNLLRSSSICFREGHYPYTILRPPSSPILLSWRWITLRDFQSFLLSQFMPSLVIWLLLRKNYYKRGHSWLDKARAPSSLTWQKLRYSFFSCFQSTLIKFFTPSSYNRFPPQ